MMVIIRKEADGNNCAPFEDNTRVYMYIFVLFSGRISLP
jgi:hypothetical protein